MLTPPPHARTLPTHTTTTTTTTTAGGGGTATIRKQQGTGCADASQPGGHYYNKAAVGASDPWAYASYTTEHGGGGDKSQGATDTIGFGWNFPDSAGRTLVLHDHSGARVTCDVIPGN